MAPRSEETAWVPPSDEDALVTQEEKPILQEKVPEEAQETKAQELAAVDPFVSESTNFCSNLFGTLLGKTKICDHCRLLILNSESRVVNKVGEKKIYFHSDCKTARTTILENKKALHKDLLTFFEIKESLVIKLQAERQAARDAAAARAQEEANKKQPRKKGFLSKLFRGRRSTRAAV